LKKIGKETLKKTKSKHTHTHIHRNNKKRRKTKKMSDEKREKKMEKEEEEKTKIDIGITPEGEKFEVPKTFDVMHKLLTISKWKEIPILVNIIIGAFYLICLTMTNIAKEFYLGSFIVFRLGYDVGLGMILKKQSETRWFTKLYEKHIKNNETYKNFIRNNFTVHERVSSEEEIKKGIINYEIKAFNPDKYPTAYASWMVFRAVVDVILINDVVTYAAFVLAYWDIPKEINMYTILMYIVGIGLSIFAFWSKMDAHRVIGDFAWYWGDFFYLVPKTLQFDGIFQCVPHPMYTVGYFFMYGAAFMSQNVTVLYVSFAAHILQLIFLTIVENPHIEKTYGQMQDELKNTYAKSGFTKEDFPLLYFKLNPWSPEDLFFIVITTYLVIIGYVIRNPYFHLVHAIVWRCIHILGGSYILHFQSKSNWWVNSFLNRHLSPQIAFHVWKKLYNTSLSINHVLFGIAAFHFFDVDVVNKNEFAFRLFFCIVLVFLNIYASWSVYHVLGEFGWYYGDFFVKDIPVQLTYDGIYRYMNNPDAVFGFSAYYGMAVLCWSPYVLFLAILASICQFGFGSFIEGPHMQRRYGKDNIRRHGGISTTLETNVKSVVLDKIVPLLENVLDDEHQLYSVLQTLQGSLANKKKKKKSKKD